MDFVKKGSMVFTAQPDENAEDPRDWGWGGEVARIACGHDSTIRRLSASQHPHLKEFSRVFVESGSARAAYPGSNERAEFAARVVNRLNGLTDSEDKVRVMQVTGYSQSDWWMLVAAGSFPLESMASWLRGDVFVVTAAEVRTCDLGDRKSVV